MPTVLRAFGLRFVIYSNDHEPAHVHVIKGNGEAKIDLWPQTPRLVWCEGLSHKEARHAYEAVLEHREFLKKKWDEIHG